MIEETIEYLKGIQEQKSYSSIPEKVKETFKSRNFISTTGKRNYHPKLHYSTW